MRDPMGKPALEKKITWPRRFLYVSPRYGQHIPCFDRFDHRILIFNIKEGRYKPELHLSINLIICSMAVILRNFTIVVTAVVRTRSRTIPLAFFYHEKSDSRVSMTMGHRVPALWAAGAPLI